VIAKFTAASSFSSVPSIPSATASSTTSRRAQSGDDTAPFARLKAKSKDMRPKSKVSDWLAKKSEDGSVDSDDSQSEDEHAGPKSKEVHSDTEDEDDDDVDHGDNDEFDLELVSKKVLRSRPTDRIHYLRHDLHLGVTGSSVFFAGDSVNANLVVLDLTALAPAESRQVVYVLLDGLLRHGDEKTHDAIVEVLLQALRVSDMQVTEDLVSWVYDQTISVGAPTKT
jgi:hypothetical protein